MATRKIAAHSNGAKFKDNVEKLDWRDSRSVTGAAAFELNA
jgi:hypothetical protein